MLPDAQNAAIVRAAGKRQDGATRAGAIRFATWSEIDLENRVWTIQPGRQASKIPAGDKAKRIPLTAPMAALLGSLPRLEGSDLLFWAPRAGR